MVKIGDFGISKRMSTKFQGAQTILGTPYYLSPEMVFFFNKLYFFNKNLTI